MLSYIRWLYINHPLMCAVEVLCWATLVPASIYLVITHL